jgi:ATP-dependent DNA helicase DinG
MSGTDDTSVTLESLLLPNTPPSIRKNYLTLAQRAQEKDFGPLEEDLVVLDTETTGLSFKNCELLEIACARLSGKKVVDRYHTFVRPKGLIPPEIVALTGIHQSDVADAPSPADAVAGPCRVRRGRPRPCAQCDLRPHVRGVRAGRIFCLRQLDRYACALAYRAAEPLDP